MPGEQGLANLSQRGTAASAGSRETIIWDVLDDLWHPQDNPDGFVSLGLAENALMHTELAQFIKKTTDVPEQAFTYGDGPTGSKRLRSAISRFLTKGLQTALPIKPEHVVLTNGVTTAIEHCAWMLGNEGDGFLLGQPHYGAFVSDMGARAAINTVKVKFGDIDPCSLEAVTRYEEALLASSASGTKIKALMLCSPHNPLGRCYSRETLIALMRLCQKHHIHLISDEIYAFSTWSNTIDSSSTDPAAATTRSTTPFTSILSIDPTSIISPSHLHVLWGLSKDFGANGLRLACVISQSNPSFLAAIRTVGLYTCPSSISDHIAANLLEDDDFTDRYIRTNQRRLAESYAFAATFLRAHHIPYAPGANAAFFLWVNFGSVYRQRKLEDDDDDNNNNEGDVTAEIMARLMEHKIFLASGESFGAEEPGWFRIVFSQPREYLAEGLRRIVTALGLETHASRPLELR